MRNTRTKVLRKGLALPFLMAAVCGVLAAAGLTAYVTTKRAEAASRMAYSPTGFGGWLPIQPAPPPSADPLKPIEAAYAAGRYAEAEKQAEQIVLSDEAAKSPEIRKNAARAMWILAYCSARKGEYSPARDRFAMLREMASALPDHGAYPRILGEELPTLEEEGAFQYAVCVGALGDKQAAEADYRDFMKEYPRSVLVHAAVKRIAKYHGGDLPKDAQQLWNSAMAAQKKVNDAADTASSLCGPECVAELMRRLGTKPASQVPLPKSSPADSRFEAGRVREGQGEGDNSFSSVMARLGTAPPSVAELAGEMRTSGRGTSLADLAGAARKHGMHVTPLEMASQYLRYQRLPAIAYVKPGHFVIVDKVSDQGVDVWDPDLKGPGKAGVRTEPAAAWNRDWSGILLEVRW